MSWHPFVKGGLGYLEFELCKMFGITPKELGVKRRKDPEGMAYLERTIIYKLEQEAKAHKEAMRKAKGRRHR